jgi:hypothetical protein
MAENLLNNMSYTNKSFQDVYEEMLDLAKKLSYRWDPSESNESDPGVVLLKLCAILADKLNYNIDKNVLECFPNSVTQESNARNLFEQLGYSMHWYKGATVNIQVAWKDEDTGYNYNLPRFSMVSNDDNSIIYTLVEDAVINSDGTVAEIPAIQGVVQDFMINGDYLITTQNLDSNNRIYFNNYNVAENGIFIKNSLFGYDDWKKVNNLNIENLGKPIYKFGLDQYNGVCYLEFPDDAYDIFGDGIYIKYIVTDGEDGNISSKIINKFFNDPSVYYTDIDNNEQSFLLTTTNINVTNLDSARNGDNPETIEDAYKNYQKTIGTFDTLVTLRDYNNAIRSAKINNINIVSNGFVTDRTNDIQCSYKIVTDVQDIQKIVNKVEDNANSEPSILAFDLKMYLLENISSSNNIIQSSANINNSSNIYNSTFNVLDNTVYSEAYEIDMLKQYLEENKSLQHDFQPLLSDKLCMIKNKYPIECKIIPQYKLTAVQAASIKANVLKSLYNYLNSRKIEFGEDIAYDKIYNIIINSDERIKSLMLGNIEYTTYAVYFDSSSETYKEIEINSLDNFITGYYNNADERFYYDYNESASPQFYNKITLIDDIYYKSCVSDQNSSTKVVGLSENELINLIDQNTGKIKNGAKLMINFKYQAMPTTNQDTILYLQLYNSQSNVNVQEPFEIKESINGAFYNLSPEKSLCWDAGSTRFLTFNGTYWVIDFESNYSSINNLYTFVDLLTGKCYKYTNGKASSYIKSDIQLDIYAKSVLGGVTQLLEPDNVFEYRLNHKFIDYVKNIKNISTNANISLESSSNEASKKLKDNECIRFYSPSLIDDKTYSSYVKFQYALAQEVQMDSDYMLSGDESITFYWKESDDENASYLYYRYGAGTIIHPNFTLRNPVGYMSLNDNSIFGVSSSHEIDDIKYVGSRYQIGKGLCTYSDSKILSDIYNNDYILSSTKSIIIRKKVETTINYPQYAYWILNEKKSTNIDGQYIYQLFKAEKLKDGESEIKQSYILQPGEYFIYTDAAKTSMEILYAGTKITRTSNSKRIEDMSCYVSDINSIVDGDISDVGNLLKQINYNETITATEMQIKTVPSEATLYLSALTWEPDVSAISDPANLTGIRIYGEGNTPIDGTQKIVPSSGQTAYNLEYQSSWQWVQDIDSEENEVYSTSGVNYGENIDITELSTNIDPFGKNPTNMGAHPKMSYSHINTYYVPDFYSGEYYEYVNGEYVKLVREPADWQTNYTNYYWLKPDHAYNPKYSSEIVWKNDDDQDMPNSDKSPYRVLWEEDDEYFAAGYQINENNVYPDLIKLDSEPDDADRINTMYGTSIYNWENYYNLTNESSDVINGYINNLYNFKYFRVGLNAPYDWYFNTNYRHSLENRLPKTTYHAYNPKYKFINYIWVDDSEANEYSEEDLKNYIKITGNGCTPSSCILIPENNKYAYSYLNNNGTTLLNVWKGVSTIYSWQLLSGRPSAADNDTTRILFEPAYDLESTVLRLSTEQIFNNYDYLWLMTDSEIDESNTFWYQKIIETNIRWETVNLSEHPEITLDFLQNENAIELYYGSNPIVGEYVALIPKPGLHVMNIQTDAYAIEVYETTYFKVGENYLKKSWKQNILFDQSVTSISTEEETTPEIQNITPVIGEHVSNQFDSYVWLEDYSYAFEDNVSSNIGSLINNATSVSGVGKTPNDLDILATQDGRAYNPEYAYNYIWLEDSEYTKWSNPLVILTGYDESPYNNYQTISPNVLNQHIVNPNYISGYVWTRLNSAPSLYPNQQSISDGIINNDIYDYNLSDSGSLPTIDANKTNCSYALNLGSNPNVWYQKSAIRGKSWTSTRIAVGKSWTAYNTTVSNSWTGMNQYNGKSWHSEIVTTPMLWRSVQSAINVIFKKDGAEINAPTGYTLNDFSISSQLNDSSSVENWPKVIVDDGWEAYSSLNLKVSKNMPFELYENQSLDWYSNIYRENEDITNSYGTLAGEYIWEEYDFNRSYDKEINILLLSDFSKNNIYCDILPDLLHVYDKEQEKSWTGDYLYVLQQDAEAQIYDDSIEIYTDPNEQYPDRAGIHYYRNVDGVIISYTSVQSQNKKWYEDSDYAAYGIRSINTEFRHNSQLRCNLPAQPGILIRSEDETNYYNYISTYVPLIVVSDYGYDIEGGYMIDVSRQNIEGKMSYMNLYAYETINYIDNDISLDGNLIKINMTYNEYMNVDSTDITFVQNKYYSRSGSGTVNNPYEYTLLTIEPSDWEDPNRDYYKKTNYLDSNYSIEKTLDFNFPNGKYLLIFMNATTNIDSLTISISPIINDQLDNLKVVLNEFGDSSFNNFKNSRKYYIDLDLDYLKENYNSFNNCDMYRLFIDTKFKQPTTSYYETKGYLSFDLAYKYDKKENMSQDFFDAIINKIYFLDKDKLYNFAYIVDKDVLIDNPLDSASFLNKDHIYNKFTICQIDTDNSDIYVTNSNK